MSTKETNPKDAIGATKVALSLLSPIAKAAWSLAQFAGMTKYGHYNWRVTGVRMSVYLDAIDRHRDALLSGEWLDPVDGTPHLGNIMACCAIIIDARVAGKLIDDRPPSVCLRSTYAETEAQMARLKVQYADKKPKHYYIEDTQVPEEWGDVNIEGCAAPDTEREITATFDGVPFPVDRVKPEPFELVIDFNVADGRPVKAENIYGAWRRFFNSLKSVEPIDIVHPELGPRVLVTPPPKLETPRFREGDIVEWREALFDKGVGEGVFVGFAGDDSALVRWLIAPDGEKKMADGQEHKHGLCFMRLLRRPVRVGDVLKTPRGSTWVATERDVRIGDYTSCAHADGTPIDPPPAAAVAPASKFREGDVVKHALGMEGVFKGGPRCYVAWTTGNVAGCEISTHETSLTLLRRPVRVGDVLCSGDSKDRRVVESVSVAGSSQYNPGPGFRFVDGGFISYANAVEGSLPSLRCTHEDGTPIEPPLAIDPDAPICGAV